MAQTPPVGIATQPHWIALHLLFRRVCGYLNRCRFIRNAAEISD